MKCEAGHTEYNPLCVCCDSEQRKEESANQNSEYFVVRPKTRDHDGLTRIVIDTYQHFCMTNEFIEMLNEHTGMKWEHLGTFMDNSCFATSEPVTHEFKVPYPKRKK